MSQGQQSLPLSTKTAVNPKNWGELSFSVLLKKRSLSVSLAASSIGCKDIRLVHAKSSSSALQDHGQILTSTRTVVLCLIPVEEPTSTFISFCLLDAARFHPFFFKVQNQAVQQIFPFSHLFLCGTRTKYETGVVRDWEVTWHLCSGSMCPSVMHLYCFSRILGAPLLSNGDNSVVPGWWMAGWSLQVQHYCHISGFGSDSGSRWVGLAYMMGLQGSCVYPACPSPLVIVGLGSSQWASWAHMADGSWLCSYQIRVLHIGI